MKNQGGGGAGRARFDMMAWPPAIRAVAAWEVGRLARAHEEAGGGPLSEETLRKLRESAAKLYRFQADHPETRALRAAATEPLDYSSQHDVGQHNRTGEFPEELRFPMMWLRTRWEPSRVLGRVGEDEPWEVIIEAPRFGIIG